MLLFCCLFQCAKQQRSNKFVHRNIANEIANHASQYKCFETIHLVFNSLWFLRIFQLLSFSSSFSLEHFIKTTCKPQFPFLNEKQSNLWSFRLFSSFLLLKCELQFVNTVSRKSCEVIKRMRKSSV